MSETREGNRSFSDISFAGYVRVCVSAAIPVFGHISSVLSIEIYNHSRVTAIAFSPSLCTRKGPDDPNEHCIVMMLLTRYFVLTCKRFPSTSRHSW
jgi:hypothetical protein